MFFVCGVFFLKGLYISRGREKVFQFMPATPELICFTEQMRQMAGQRLSCVQKSLLQKSLSHGPFSFQLCSMNFVANSQQVQISSHRVNSLVVAIVVVLLDFRVHSGESSITVNPFTSKSILQLSFDYRRNHED